MNSAIMHARAAKYLLIPGYLRSRGSQDANCDRTISDTDNRIPTPTASVGDALSMHEGTQRQNRLMWNEITKAHNSLLEKQPAFITDLWMIG